MIDINDSEFLSRIEPKELLDKVCDGKAAAAMIQPGDILGISGFTPCGSGARGGGGHQTASPSVDGLRVKPVSMSVGWGRRVSNSS